MDTFVLPRAFRVLGPKPLYPPWTRHHGGDLIPRTSWRYARRFFVPGDLPALPAPLSQEDLALPLYAAYLLSPPTYRYEPGMAPLLQAATLETLYTHLVDPWWNVGWLYVLDSLPPPDVPQLLIRTKTYISSPEYEYLVILGVEESAGAKPHRSLQGVPWKEWTREEALGVFADAAQEVLRRRRRLSWVQITSRMSPQFHRNTVSKIYRKHEITLDETRSRR